LSNGNAMTVRSSTSGRKPTLLEDFVCVRDRLAAISLQDAAEDYFTIS
jgi:hypothetical protein